MKISAVIITKNEELNIARCLASLHNVADEIIVVDSGSTDSTQTICEQYQVKFVATEWQGYAATKNFANNLAQGEYILSLDADEALSDTLIASLQAAKAQLSGTYEFNRLTKYCGRWVRHGGWYPDRKLRLFPKDKARWEGEHVHETLKVEAGLELKYLPGDLLHYSIYSVEDHIARINKYSSLAAQEMYAKGKKATWTKLLFSPLIRFLRMYLFKMGWRDGFHGLLIAALSAHAAFLRYAKLKALSSFPTKQTQ